jgi:glycosyltransferase involved in cell wall biosynthesis
MNEIKDNSLSHILMIGVDQNTPGGMAAVVKTYSQYFISLKYISTWKSGGYFVKVCYAVKALIVAFIRMSVDYRIRIVHIHTAAYASFYRKSIFVKMSKLFGKKVILHMHAADFEAFFQQSKNPEKILRIIKLCDVLVVLSQSWKQYFMKIGIAESKIAILNNIVSPPIIKEVKSKSVRIKLLFLGEIGKRKGVYDLLDVLHANRHYYHDKLELRIGGNLEEDKLKGTLLNYGLTEFVTFEGWISGEKKIECLNWADIFILPSYNEGLPIAILESMSYGLPVISTNVGGIPEVLKTHKNGILITPGNLEEIDSSIRYFVNHKEKICEYGNCAKESIKEYLAESVVEKLQQLYNSI